MMDSPRMIMRENEHLKGKKMGDKCEVPMIVKGIEAREDYGTGPSEVGSKENKKPKKEYNFYTLEAQPTEMKDDEDFMKSPNVEVGKYATKVKEEKE